MSGRLLDTNIIIDFLNDRIDLPSWIDEQKEIYVSEITMGELFYGTANSKRKQENRRIYLSFCEELYRVPIDAHISEVYGSVKADLRKTGNLIPENDIWIAATAIALNLVLVTNDSHFLRIEGLKIEIIQ